MPWEQLEHDLTTWLKGFSNDKVEYRGPNQAIIGFPSDGFRSDGMLTDGRTLLALEIESGQAHPDTNVGKYWFLSESYKRYDRIVLFHIFTPLFGSYGWRKSLANFITTQSAEKANLDYPLLDYRKVGNYSDALRDIKDSIKAKIADFLS
jgi:hypothetical protein